MSAEIPWDKGQALDDIAQACIDGDVEAARLGWLRLTEAGTNASYAKFAAMVIELRALRADLTVDEALRMEDVASTEHTIGLVISTVEVEQAAQGRMSAQLGLLELAVSELAITVKALRARVRTLENR